jgi:choline kinase
MHAVILAAGDGGRLHPHTAGVPKPLLTLRGRPILNHVLDALDDGGVSDATVVVGYHGDQIRRALADLAPRGMRIGFAENPDYLLGNARSIWAARAAVAAAPGFLLAMGDHLVEPSMVAALAAGAAARCRLAIDRAAPADPRAAEATLARVRDGRVVDLGKGLRDWNALDTGLFWCAPRLFEAMTPQLRDGEAGALFAALAHAGQLDAVDVTGSRWIDVDTEHDLRAAETMMGAHGRVA